MDRYDDRLIVKTNLTLSVQRAYVPLYTEGIESYEVLMDFIAKHTPDKFALVDNCC